SAATTWHSYSPDPDLARLTMTTTVPAAATTEVDHRDPELRLRTLFDSGTLRLLRPRDSSGVVCARGEIDGTPAVAYATDGMTMGGAMGVDGCRHIVETIDTAVRE